MAERMTIQLYQAVQAHAALAKAWSECIKPMIVAGNRMVLEVKPESKTRDQEEKYHAMIGEVAKQSQHLGSMWSAEDWKRLLIDKFARETGLTHGKVIPNLDKNGVVEVGVQSRKFSRATGSNFIEWLHCWGAENGVTFSSDHINQETGEIH